MRREVPGVGGRLSGPLPANVSWPLPHLPIVKHREFSLSSGRKARIEAFARRLLRSDQRLRHPSVLHPGVGVGLGPWPTLHVHDRSLDPDLPQQRFPHQYRALLLGGDGDMVAVNQTVSPGFETYCRNVLGLGMVTVLRARDDARRSLFASLLRDPHCLDAVVRVAKEQGGLNVLPYIGGGGAWALASRVAERARVPLRVGAPHPWLTMAVNDKVWFSDVARELLGSAAIPTARSAQSWIGLIRLLSELSKVHDTLGLKLPSTSGSWGIVVINSAEVRGVPLRQLRARMKELLGELGWNRPFPMLVTVWEAPVLVTPSVQTWIPNQGDGAPVVEGVFDQKVAGAEARFFGCAPTRLPERWLNALSQEAGMMSTLFQSLGYFGRCSFDAILVGDDLSEASLHWVECNGRWGGTSIPMTLANRLVGDYGHRPFVTTGQIPVPDARTFAAVLRRLEGRLWGASEKGKIVLLGPGPDTGLAQANMMAFGQTVERAERELRLAAEALSEL